MTRLKNSGFSKKSIVAPERLQGLLLLLAALFIFIYSLSLTISPAVRARTWQTDLRYTQWIGFFTWAIVFLIIHFQSVRLLPSRDPYLLPVAALMSGWGLMTIYRLLPGFGLRQSAWLAVGAGVLIAGLRLPANLGYLRKHKYLLLVGGLTLTALTIIFGTNPLGNGPRMWLGCCGIYLQPSEPLKLLLVIYLAAFLADLQVSMIIRNDTSRTGAKSPPGSVFTLLAPTLVMLSLALILLLAQRDLGTASIFLFLYTAMLFLSTGHKRILVIGAILIGFAGIAGFAAFDLVRLRFEAWLNPWLDPSGHSYQIVQSILAIANGGVFGRGPGLGNPGLVPIPHSDFIFAAIAEESGLAGVIALVILIAFLAGRGITIALNAQDHFRRLLAAGLTAFIVGQSILIAGGNVRLLPLTGVTLPLVSYGGSSMVTSFVAVLLLLQISSLKANKPVPLSISRIYLFFGGLLFAGLVSVALVTGWWAVFRSPGLLTRTDNARRTISDRDVRRGALVDKRGQPINQSLGQPGSYSRSTSYPDLSAFVGYTNPTFGQSGLEAELDPYLRGTQGNSDWLVWWNHLLYGEPPPGLDVRLSLDLAIQQKADALLNQHPGALVLLNANTGEVLAVSTRPTFDANHLETNWQDLIANPETPLVNRATQGSYPPGAALAPFLLAQSESDQAQLLELPPAEQKVTCALSPLNRTWTEMIRSGCAESLTRLMDILGYAQSQQLFERLGLIFPTQSATSAVNPTRAAVSAPPGNLSVSPLEMALAAASISSGGKRPALRTASAVNIPDSGWVPLPGEPPLEVFPEQSADLAADQLKSDTNPIWETLAVAERDAGHPITWYLGGSLPGITNTPLVVAVVLEENDPQLASQIGQQLLLDVQATP